MKLVERHLERDTVILEDLDAGDTFWYGDEYYVAPDTSVADQYFEAPEDHRMVMNLSSSRVTFFALSLCVKRVEATVNIEVPH